MYDLICLGNSTIDDVIHHNSSVTMGCFGGDAIYAGLSAAMWSKKVEIVAPIGIDYPDENLKDLEKFGWSIQGMPRRNAPSIRSWVIYSNNEQRTWIRQTNSSNTKELSPFFDDIPKLYLKSKGFLILAMNLSAQEDVINELYKRKNVLIALDPQEDNLRKNKDQILKLLRKIDIFLPSEIEVKRLLGHSDFRKAAKEFSEFGCKIICIKLGEKGSLIYDAERKLFQKLPCYKTDAIDTTGAGDSFSGGFITKYILCKNLYKAGIAGTVSSSFTVEGYGLNHLFSVTSEQIKNRYIHLLENTKEVWS